jgi:tRNA A-37 threonylcarbamoyl transferase component Bud32
MDERRGNRLGRYEILSELGRGAVGVVYKGRDPKINRIVAIKTFSLAGQTSEEEKDFRERFVREAEAAGRVSHPGIVTIFDVGEEEKTREPYIVMEYVGGQSLDKVLAANDNVLPVETALQVTHELAEALDCAHVQGVIHRDLKPANILVTEDGRAKIADFGVAKLNLANQTLAGRALGTPAYMSPEQLNGETVDGRSDLFSLGVVLYTVLTGYRPFQGNSAMTVSYKVVNREPIPATVLDTDLPPGLDYIIGRAMAKDRAKRYQRGMEMAWDIEDLRAGRELRSKTAVASAGSVAAVGAADTLATAAKAGATTVSGLKRAGRGGGVGRKLLHEVDRRSVATILFVVGLGIFGLRIWPLLGSKKKVEGGKIEASAPTAKRVETILAEAEATLPMDAAAPKTEPLPSSEPSPAAAPTLKPKVKKNVPKTAIIARSTTPKQVTPPPAANAAPVVEPALLDIEVEHKFQEASLLIWVDSHLTYTHDLTGADKKHLVVFHSVQGHEFHAVQIPPGNHELKVEVNSEGPAKHSAAVAGEFVSGQEKTLHIHFDKHGEMNLALE